MTIHFFVLNHVEFSSFFSFFYWQEISCVLFFCLYYFLEE